MFYHKFLIFERAAVIADSHNSTLVSIVAFLVAQVSIEVELDPAIGLRVDADCVPVTCLAVVVTLLADAAIHTSTEVVAPPADAGVVSGMARSSPREKRNNTALRAAPTLPDLHAHVSWSIEHRLCVGIVLTLAGSYLKTTMNVVGMTMIMVMFAPGGSW